jgi:hypothetical protein
MKKLIVAGLLFSFITLKSQNADNTNTNKNTSRSDSRSRIHLGIKAGLNSSNVYDEQESQFYANSKYGFVGGAFLSIPIGTYLGIRPEVLFSQKGFRGRGDYRGSSYNISRTTSYIDVPVLLEFKPIRLVTFVGGPHYSYLLHQLDIFSNGNNIAAIEQEFGDDNVRKNILGATIGLDINLFGRLIVGVRYAVDLQNNNGDGSSSSPRYKNKWLQGTLGLRLF